MKNINHIFWFLLFGMILIVGCSDNEEFVPEAPTSDDLSFTFTVDDENPNLIHFNGQTTADTWFMHWNFGDNTGAEGLMPSKVFFKAGTYEVRFRIFTEGGTASQIQTIVIEQDFQGPDLIENGSFDDGIEGWTIFQISGGVELGVDGGQASWTGGAWGNAGIYQQVEVEANKEYTISLDVSGSGMSECWFEVYMGTVMPQENVDYSSGGILIGLNTWEGCGAEEFSGQLIDLACVGDGATFTWEESQTAYFVIKSGGADLGVDGVTIDNIAVRSL